VRLLRGIPGFRGTLFGKHCLIIPFIVRYQSRTHIEYLLKMTDFWVVAPCSLVEVYRRFTGACCLRYQGPDDEGSTYETSVNFYQTTRRNNPEDSHLHTGRRENLKSQKTILFTVLSYTQDYCWSWMLWVIENRHIQHFSILCHSFNSYPAYFGVSVHLKGYQLCFNIRNVTCLCCDLFI
jgi:hypothetical protein